jgi:RNA polymerase sigma factor (sigma-70 family)
MSTKGCDVNVEETVLAQEFEQHRVHLTRVAYRMLGSASEAEDAVQEAWLRLRRVDSTAVANLGGWLTTVVARVCLDFLRSRRSRGEEPRDGQALEPIVSVDPGPEEEALLADSVGVALLVVLETLTPAERLAFVLHDMFAVPFAEIGAILERSPDAVRQLASRARRRVRGAAPSPDPDPAHQRRLVDAFLAASRNGDFEALVAVLHPDAAFRLRGDAVEPVSVRGAEEVARVVLERGSRLAHLARPAIVNGSAGLLLGDSEQPFSVVAFAVVGGRIASIDVLVGPTLGRLA